MDRRFEGSLVAYNRRQTQMKQPIRSRRQAQGIDVLPEEVLLEIFDFYMKYAGSQNTEAWHTLVHVCRLWRTLVLGSPHRLDLRLYCTPKNARDTLDVWPALPLIVEGKIASSSTTDNVIAALQRSDRVCRVRLWELAGRQLEKVLAAMQAPFPVLTGLFLRSNDETVSVIPDSFLGGSAPRLRLFRSDGIPLPGLPNLLLSSNHLVTLWLTNIPHSGYFSPGSMVALLFVLSSLESLSLEFQSPQSCPDREIHRPSIHRPSERSVIPALTYLRFKGVFEYLEDLVTCIDAPQLDDMHITFFNDIEIDIPQLAQFISSTPKLMKPKLMKPNAHVQFDDCRARVVLRPGSRTLRIAISCKGPDWQLSSIEQVCNYSSNLLSRVEDLYIEHQYAELVWKDDTIDNTQWLKLLFPFTAVKNLYLSEEFAPSIATALKELVGDRITEMLPNLQNIFVEPSGRFQENIRQFVSARPPSYHPIAISLWDK